MKKKEIIKSISWILKMLKKTPEEYVDDWNKCHDELRCKLQYEDYYPFVLGFVESELKWIVREVKSERA